MNDKDHKPTFSTSDYVRPNTDWVCGRQCEGNACRVGPSGGGKCRATYECQPLLDLKPGETKGSYKCTRPSTAGGKCDLGPLPDGTCCKAIPKCQPRRTLRAIRKRVVIFTAIASCFILFIGLDRSNRDNFINPGPLSSPHSSRHFTQLTENITGDATSCAACHEGARSNGASWLKKFGDAFNGKLAPGELIKKGPIGPYQSDEAGGIDQIVTGMDKNCLACHQGMTFHQPNMPAGFACHSCHKEHVGGGAILPVGDDYCTSCHGSEELMKTSRELANTIDPHSFPSIKAKPSSSRPKEGYTKLIKSFADGHPEFRILREKTEDSNTLKFGHEYHLTSAQIPAMNGGRALSCTDCHTSDAKGEYQLPITYEQHCKSCHALEFDGNTPGLALPHGDPTYVRAFLRSLNIQYEEFGKTNKNIVSKKELTEFVEEKRADIEKAFVTGSKMERAVFFSDKYKKLKNGETGVANGCMLCHTVMEPPTSNGTPLIAPVIIPTRWLEVGKFSHEPHKIAADQAGIDHYIKYRSKYDEVAYGQNEKVPEYIENDAHCIACHNVLDTNKTSEIILPGIASCIKCHSPETGVDHSCVLCHTYHNNTGRTSLFEGIGDTAPVEDKESEEK
jgi:hypothetical protein